MLPWSSSRTLGCLLSLLTLLGCALDTPAPEKTPAPRVVLFPDRSAKVFLPNTLEGYGQPRGSRKKGCGGCNENEMSLAGAKWSYVWSPYAGPGRVPLVKPHLHSVQKAQIPAAREGWLMFGNEPDLEGPPPANAVPKYVEAESLGVKLLLSTGSQLDAGQHWAKAFRKAYRSRHGRWPQIDALGAHCYYDPFSTAQCMAQVGRVLRLAQDWGVGEVWVTEFACLPGTHYSLEDCFAASHRFICWMENESAISRYFLFGARIDPQKEWNNGSSYNSLFYPYSPNHGTHWLPWYRTEPGVCP